jgi:hypothetical protein
VPPQDAGVLLGVKAASACCRAAPAAGAQVSVSVDGLVAGSSTGGEGSVTCQTLAADVEVRLGGWVGGRVGGRVGWGGRARPPQAGGSRRSPRPLLLPLPPCPGRPCAARRA